VSSDWVQLVNKFFAQHPEVGGCGEPVFENDQVPSWFKWFNKSYAAGPQFIPIIGNIHTESGQIFA
jgi:hypothetical protein